MTVIKLFVRDTAEIRILDSEFKRILQIEAHMNERCVEQHYKAEKNKYYYDRVSLKNLHVETTAARLASHPEWFPDIEITIDGQKCCVELGERPCTVVKPNGTYIIQRIPFGRIATICIRCLSTSRIINYDGFNWC